MQKHAAKSIPREDTLTDILRESKVSLYSFWLDVRTGTEMTHVSGFWERDGFRNMIFFVCSFESIHVSTKYSMPNPVLKCTCKLELTAFTMRQRQPLILYSVPEHGPSDMTAHSKALLMTALLLSCTDYHLSPTARPAITPSLNCNLLHET